MQIYEYANMPICKPLGKILVVVGLDQYTNISIRKHINMQNMPISNPLEKDSRYDVTSQYANISIWQYINMQICEPLRKILVVVRL